METFSALLIICAENSSPVTRGSVFLDLILNNGWTNKRHIGDLERHRAHYDITVMNYQVRSWVSFPVLVMASIVSNMMQGASIISPIMHIPQPAHNAPIDLHTSLFLFKTWRLHSPRRYWFFQRRHAIKTPVNRRNGSIVLREHTALCELCWDRKNTLAQMWALNIAAAHWTM